MSVRVFYSRGKEYIPDEADFLICLNDEEFRGMIPVIKALNNRSGNQVSFDSNINLSTTAVDSLIKTLNDILETGRYKDHLESIETLNNIARQAQSKNLGLIFLTSIGN